MVYGQVAIDSSAGPSEVLVIADHSANSDQVAADLLAQAEHDSLAAAVLITTDPALADGINAAVAEQLADHPRQEIAAAQDWGLVVICDDLESCAHLSDSFAPEHLELLVERPEPWRIAFRTPEPFSSAPGPQKRWGITWQARTTRCPPVEPRVSAGPSVLRPSCATPR